MNKPGLSQATRRRATIWNVIQSFRKPNERIGCVFVVISVAVLLSTPGLLCGQERHVEGEKYLLLSDGSVHNGPPPSNGLFVRGTVSSSNVFRPSGNVEGDGEFADRGVPGWIELSSNNFIRQDMGMSPRPPYVKGFLGSDNVFRPQTREVVYGK
jgi:hypothetical protein